jgi:hypothetical protein
MDGFFIGQACLANRTSATTSLCHLCIVKPVRGRSACSRLKSDRLALTSLVTLRHNNLVRERLHDETSFTQPMLSA